MLPGYLRFAAMDRSKLATNFRSKRDCCLVWVFGSVYFTVDYVSTQLDKERRTPDIFERSTLRFYTLDTTRLALLR